MPPPSSVPEGLAWDLWLGPAAKRELYRDYLPFKWRAFYDFGLGMLGDWGCHTLDTPVWVMDLDPPTVVECLDRKESLDGLIPADIRIKYHFPATGISSALSRAGRSASGCAPSKAKGRSWDRTSPIQPGSPRSSC